LKIRYPDFTTVTRSRTLPDPTDSTQGVFAVAAELLAGTLPRGAAVRLLGVRVEQLVGSAAAEQLTLDGVGDSAFRPGMSWASANWASANWASANWAGAERAVDAARSRFGDGAVRLASLLADPGGSDREQANLSPESGNESG
jgi:DNA polymerase-4